MLLREGAGAHASEVLVLCCSHPLVLLVPQGRQRSLWRGKPSLAVAGPFQSSQHRPALWPP